MLGGLIEVEVSKYSGRKVKREKVWKYGNRTIGSFIELRIMVGESYEATSWRSGTLSIVSIVSNPKKSRARQHWGKG